MEHITDIDLSKPLTTEDERIFKNLLGVLPRRQLAVVDRRFGLSDGRQRTYQEIGDEFFITRERVRQLIERAIRLLRSPFSFRKVINANGTFVYSDDFSDVFPKDRRRKRAAKLARDKQRAKQRDRAERRAREREEERLLAAWNQKEVPSQQIPEWILDYTILATKQGSLRIPYRNVVKFIERPRRLAKQIVIAMDKRGYARVGIGMHVKIINHQEITIRTCDNTKDESKFFIVVSRR